MNKYRYLYTVMDDYYGFPGTFYEEVLSDYVIFHGAMTVADLQKQYEINVMKYIADSNRLYKVKEIK